MSKKAEDKKTGSNKIEVIEEQLSVDKKEIETGKVRLTKTVVEEDVSTDLTLTEENIDVKVKKVNQIVEQRGPASEVQGDTTIYYVYKEIYVKQIILEEEVHVRRVKSTNRITDLPKLKKEKIHVDRIKN